MDHSHQSMSESHPLVVHDSYSRSLNQALSLSRQQQQYFSFVISLFLSFTLGSVILLMATLVWHSELSFEMMKELHSAICNSQLFQLTKKSQYCSRKGFMEFL
mmetsp:Transcript_7523/g.13109  ORF Transcript_7523/g.13109 Transcript_7523/m.13109 type:complete len:103 (+) Transcript_7523:307-615(+)